MALDTSGLRPIDGSNAPDPGISIDAPPPPELDTSSLKPVTPVVVTPPAGATPPPSSFDVSRLKPVSAAPAPPTGAPAPSPAPVPPVAAAPAQPVSPDNNLQTALQTGLLRPIVSAAELPSAIKRGVFTGIDKAVQGVGDIAAAEGRNYGFEPPDIGLRGFQQKLEQETAANAPPPVEDTTLNRVVSGAASYIPALAGPILGIPYLAAQGAASASDRAYVEAPNATQDQVDQNVRLNAVVGGALGSIPGLGILKSLGLDAMKGVTGFAARTALAGGAGLSIGGLVQALNNAIDKYTTNPDKVLSAGVPKSAAETGLMAMLLHGLVVEPGRPNPPANPLADEYEQSPPPPPPAGLLSGPEPPPPPAGPSLAPAPEAAPPAPRRPNRLDLAAMLESPKTATELAKTVTQDVGGLGGLPPQTPPTVVPPLPATPINPLQAQMQQLSGDGLLNVINTSKNRRMRDAATAEYTMRFPDHAATDLKKQEITQAAQDVNTSPTEPQKEAGNYQKGHVSIEGLDVSIENPRGSERTGKGEGGKPWSVTMPDHYGYVKKTEGADGDHMDVYVGDAGPRKYVYVVDQIDPTTGAFDEHKAMLHYPSLETAIESYKNAFSDGRGAARIGGVKEMTMPAFKDWLKNGDTTKPLTYRGSSLLAPLPNRPNKKQTIKIPDVSKELGAIPGVQIPEPSIPGTEPIKDKELAERKMSGRSTAKVAQKPADDGIFDVAGRGQTDLLAKTVNTASKQKSPFDALQFLASKGGVKDNAGELAAMDAGKKFLPRYGRLLRKDGISLDEAGRLLWDAGYFGPPNTVERPDINKVLELIRDGLHGKRSFSENDRSEVSEKEAHNKSGAYRDDLEQNAEHLGIDHAGMTDAQLVDEIAQQSEIEAAKGALYDDAEAEAMRHYYAGDKDLIPLGEEKNAADEIPFGEPTKVSGKSPADEVRPAPVRTRAPKSKPPVQEDKNVPGGEQSGPTVNLPDPASMAVAGLYRAQRKIEQEFAKDGALPAKDRMSDEEFSVLEDYAQKLQTEIDKRGHENPFQKKGEKLDKPLFSVRKETAPTFYSALTRSIEALPQAKASAESWYGTVKNLKGVKQEELDWSGIIDWLKSQRGPLEKSKIVDFLRANEIQVHDVLKGEPQLNKKSKYYVSALDKALRHTGSNPNEILLTIENDGDVYRQLMDKFPELVEDEDWAEKVVDSVYGTRTSKTKYSQYSLPGGKNYHELLLTLPEIPSPEKGPKGWGDTGGGTYDPKNFRSGHFEEPNIISHIRFNDRTGPDGEKILHIEELQSDWHQKGRKYGYYKNADMEAELRRERASLEREYYELPTSRDPRGKGSSERAIQIKSRVMEIDSEISGIHATGGSSAVPDAPFKTTWPELAFKRMLRYTAENGYDKITWTTGEQQAARYDLSKHINRLRLYDNDGKLHLSAWDKNDRNVMDLQSVTKENLADHIGKEAAEKLLSQKSVRRDTRSWRELSGVELKVGGDGMQGFYDTILTSIANKIGKKFGASVEDIKLDKIGPDESKTSPEFRAIAREHSGYTVHSLPITEPMRESVLQGQPLFHRNVSEAASPEPPAAPRQKVAVGLLATKANDLTETQKNTVSLVETEIGKLAPGSTPQFFAKLQADMESDGPVIIDGAYYRGFGKGGVSHVIAWSLESPDPVKTVRHEAIHYFRRTGLVTKPEWGVLEKTAEERDWIGKHEVATRYPDFEKEIQTEEAVADEYADWRKGIEDRFGHLPGRIQRTFRRIDLFQRRLAAAIREELGHPPTAEDIFTKMETGEVGARKQTVEAPLPKARAETPLFQRRKRPEEPPEEKKAPDKETFEQRLARLKASLKKASTPAQYIGTVIGEVTDSLPAKISNFIDGKGEELGMLFHPMAQGSAFSKAAAKDYMNTVRLSQTKLQITFDKLTNTFKPEQLKDMWNKMDETSVWAQKKQQESKTPISFEDLADMASKDRVGIYSLPEDQRDVLLEFNKWATFLHDKAIDAGMTEAPGIPFWTPRTMAMVDPEERVSGGAGRGFSTTSPNLKRRKHLEAEDTEAAMAELGGKLVRDIRTMPIAMSKLERAIAGKLLLNKIEQYGKGTGLDTVRYGEAPKDFFTIPEHPAFYRWEPQEYIEDEETGSKRPKKDEFGNIVFRRVPIFISNEFKGPLKAVFTGQPNIIYRALMQVKMKTIGFIMFSPLIHNMVELGRAVPILPGKVLTLKVYFEGNAAKRGIPYKSILDHMQGKYANQEEPFPPDLQEGILHGLVPIGHRGFAQDISSIMEEPSLKPGRSLIAKGLGGATQGIASLITGRERGKAAGDKVRSAVDKAGNFYSNTLLWDRIADLQMGLYINLRDEAIRDGLHPEVAKYYAAHAANLFAGAIPLEAMSEASRQLLNIFAFSRSFTAGNLQVGKAAAYGLPGDIAAQIELAPSNAAGGGGKKPPPTDKTSVAAPEPESGGPVALSKVQAYASKKFGKAIVLDIGILRMQNAILMAAVALLAGQTFGHILDGYWRRLKEMLEKTENQPSYLIGEAFSLLDGLDPTHDNEPGKENRIPFTTDPQGTVSYLKLPFGKIGEEYINWLFHPLRTLQQKESALAKGVGEVWDARDYFGHLLYDKDAEGLSANLKNIGDMVGHILEGQQSITNIFKGANNLYEDVHTGTGSVFADTMRTVGPFVGLTVSSGYPGGPAVGALKDVLTHRENAIDNARADIKDFVVRGDKDKAFDMMDSLGMTKEEETYMYNHYDYPQGAINKTSLEKFYNVATPEQQKKFERLDEESKK